MGFVDVGGVGLGLTDEVDSVLAAAFCFQQRIVGLLVEFLYCAAVARIVRSGRGRDSNGSRSHTRKGAGVTEREQAEGLP